MNNLSTWGPIGIIIFTSLLMMIEVIIAITNSRKRATIKRKRNEIDELTAWIEGNLWK